VAWCLCHRDRRLLDRPRDPPRPGRSIAACRCGGPAASRGDPCLLPSARLRRIRRSSVVRSWKWAFRLRPLMPSHGEISWPSH
jgi:hypothetical protein